MRVIKVKEVLEEEEGGKDNWKNNKDKHKQMACSKWHITF